jgi:hypothetical protein
LNISEADAEKMINDQDLLRSVVYAENGVFSGQKLEVNNNITRAIKSSKGIQTEDLGNPDSTLDSSIGYNCHTGARIISSGDDVTNKTLKNTSADSILRNDIGNYVETSLEDAISGKTIITYGNNHHSAIYYGKSQSGEHSAFSKNGLFAKPGVFPLDYINKTYGTDTNIFGRTIQNEVRFFNPTR